MQRRQEKVEDIETPRGTEAKIEEIAQNRNTVMQLREAQDIDRGRPVCFYLIKRHSGVLASLQLGACALITVD